MFVLTSNIRPVQMWLESMIESLEDVPPSSVDALSGLRAKDRASKRLSTVLNDEESALFVDLKAVQASEGKDFDETIFIEKAKSVLSKRSELVSMLEEQNKAAQEVYNMIDERISKFDARTEPLAHLLSVDHQESLSKRKKKKKKSEFGDGTVDPNEPVYCTCRMVSFGKMIGCDSDDCTVEWFHLGCVGLTEDTQPEKWYCDDCRNRLGLW